LIAKVQWDEFQERKKDIKFLEQFLGRARASNSISQQFRWALVVAAATKNMLARVARMGI
jgi:hypothetical protein